jgi:hypothetical protein
LLTPGGGRWKLNLRDDEPVKLRLRGRDITARPELVRDADEVAQLLRHMIARNPRLSSFVPFIERDGSFQRSDLETALTRGFCIVRWRLDDQDGADTRRAGARDRDRPAIAPVARGDKNGGPRDS